MSLFSRLVEKSWQTPGAERFADPADYRPSAAMVGVYLYLGVATVIFILLTGAYLLRMNMASVMDHGPGGDWRAMPDPPLLWTNTAILAASSLVWEAARRAAGRWLWGQTRLLTLLGGATGCAFLVGQLMLWWQYQAAGYYLSGNPAYAFFYLLTAVHGLHLAGGIIAGARTVGQMSEQADRARFFRNVRLCAVYWHFLLLAWVLLVGLLIST